VGHRKDLESTYVTTAQSVAVNKIRAAVAVVSPPPAKNNSSLECFRCHRLGHRLHQCTATNCKRCGISLQLPGAHNCPDPVNSKQVRNGGGRRGGGNSFSRGGRAGIRGGGGRVNREDSDRGRRRPHGSDDRDTGHTETAKNDTRESLEAQLEASASRKRKLELLKEDAIAKALRAQIASLPN
jgi:hypothetical protein